MLDFYLTIKILLKEKVDTTGVLELDVVVYLSGSILNRKSVRKPPSGLPGKKRK